ncbi:hypothetical protein B0176_04800 [Streptococcus oralis]|nr:hypothetical protein B0176_04800 [Streptococcus oralis]
MIKKRYVAFFYYEKRISSILDSEYPKNLSKKALVYKAFLLFLCPLHEFVRTFHIENKQKC